MQVSPQSGDMQGLRELSGHDNKELVSKQQLDSRQSEVSMHVASVFPLASRIEEVVPPWTAYENTNRP